MKIRRTLGVVVGLAAAASLVAGPAQAKPLEKGTFHDEFTEVEADFCDVPGLTVQFDVVVDGRFLVNPHGPDGLVYGKENIRSSAVGTNLANGKFITTKANFIGKDLKVTDNGDGTLTILTLATGNEAAFGMDGKAIARNPGQVRFELLIDHNGTPTDPTDDEFLAGELVKGSTGRNDDFCEAAVPALS
jgi:hypothetical protein